MSDERLLAFSRALADAVRSGLPMAATLRDIGLSAAAEGVSQGKTLQESLAATGKFPSVLLALIRAGEESGKVDAFLDRYSDSLESRLDFRRRLARAFFYPAFGAALAAAIFLLFSTKAAPLLLEPLIAAGVSMPPAALQAMKAGEYLLANWLLLLGAAVFIVLLARALFASRAGRAARALAGHWLPGARYVSEEARWYDLEATLELLLGAGLRPRQVMDILGESFRDDPLTRRRLAKGAVMMEQGRGFAESLAPCLPPDDRPRAEVAERSGLLDETFGKLAKTHRELHLHRLKQAATAFQLASVTALAPVCFGLILWILWPTMAVLRDAGKQLTGSGAPSAEGFPSAPPMDSSVPPETAAASRFNEKNAREVVGYMQSHAAGDGEQKKMAKIKLKDRSMQKPQFKKIEATPLKSSLD